MQIRIAFPGLLPVFFAAIAFGQPSDESHTLHIRKAQSEIVLDGMLDEAAWQEAGTAGNFFQNFPFDTSFAALQTEVRMTFDDHFLYIGAVVFQNRGDYIVSSLKRDFEQGSSDEFVIQIDPFRDKLNAFHFAVTPFNIQREGLINEGSSLATDWDNKWYSKVSNFDDRWVVEMAIPFKTLRYKRTEQANSWRINFSRIAIKANESSSWVPVPRQFETNNLAFTGLLVWEDAPPRPGVNISVIPYAIARTERDFEFKLPNETTFNGGGDAKIAITPSLNLDLTFNPDFSQVEVDRQIINLSRFELFFPERRQFFLENEDLFARFGFPESRPFFSRRVGLAFGKVRKTTTDGQVIEVDRTVNVPIVAGMRLSGKLDQNWRIGLLNMHTAHSNDIGLAPANYSVGVIQRRIFERSTIGAVFVNKENFVENSDGGYSLDRQGFNRVAGLEYNLYSKDNKWLAEVFYHRSFSAENNKDAQAAAVFLGYFTRRWRVFFPNQYIGSNHRADAGFIPRQGYLSVSPGVTHTIFPSNPKLARKLISMDIGVETDFIFNNPDQRLVDRRLSGYVSFTFPGQSEFFVAGGNEYTYLFFPFDPTNSGGEQLPEGSEYYYNIIEAGFNSDVRKKFYFEASVLHGQFFNGHRTRLSGEINFRWQPVGILAVSYSYNDISLPEPYNSASFWLVGPRAELSFSRNVFFSAFLQYNTQANNVNINSRLQWRFLPVSDLFLVYTDNYFTDMFFTDPRVKNRALVLKATYWLNL